MSYEYRPSMDEDRRGPSEDSNGWLASEPNSPRSTNTRSSVESHSGTMSSLKLAIRRSIDAVRLKGKAQSPSSRSSRESCGASGLSKPNHAG